MLKIVNNGFKTPIDFEYEVDGETQQLSIVQMSVEDEIRFHGFQTKIMEANFSENTKNAKWLVAKIACCIKDAEGNYPFDFDEELPSEVVMALLPHCNEMNPLPTEDSGLEARKK